MRFESLQDWLGWLESCHPSEIDLGLDRTAEVAGRLGVFAQTAGRADESNGELNGELKVVTVAGTNGKGSCIAALNALLSSAGYRVGCYTSPHFLHYNERILVDGQPVDDSIIVESFARVDQARDAVSLTYFEFGTLAALDIFVRSELDVVLLEVGLGGRLDAVNIVDPDVAVVTSIDIDHSDWLGTDREQIGREKAGIFRSRRPAICADPQPPQSLLDYARQLGADLLRLDKEFEQVSEQALEQTMDGGASTYWRWSGVAPNGEAMSLGGLPALSLPLPSVAAALQAIQCLGMPLDLVDYGCLAALQLPGRFQRVETEGKEVILDVAHNPAAAAYLAQRLVESPCEGRTFGLMAVMSDKDVDGIIGPLKGLFDAWFLGELKGIARAMSCTDLAQQLYGQEQQMVSVSKNIRQAYRRALSMMDTSDRLVVFGSFFTVAEVIKLQMKRQQHSASADSRRAASGDEVDE